MKTNNRRLSKKADLMEEDREQIVWRWKEFQKAQGYTDEEMAKLRSNEKFVKAMEKAPKVRDPQYNR
jgi:hypothetical protein